MAIRSGAAAVTDGEDGCVVSVTGLLPSVEVAAAVRAADGSAVGELPVYQPVVVEDHLSVVGRCLGYQISKLWPGPPIMRCVKRYEAEALVQSVL